MRVTVGVLAGSGVTVSVGSAVAVSVGGAVGGSVGSAVAGSVGSAVAGSVGSAVAGSVGSAVAGSVGSAVGGSVGTSVTSWAAGSAYVTPVVRFNARDNTRKKTPVVKNILPSFLRLEYVSMSTFFLVIVCYLGINIDKCRVVY